MLTKDNYIIILNFTESLMTKTVVFLLCLVLLSFAQNFEQGTPPLIGGYSSLNPETINDST